jgi:hypothetical protein
VVKAPRAIEFEVFRETGATDDLVELEALLTDI